MAKTYAVKLLIAVDQLANTLLDGHPDETLSARAHRQHVAGRSLLRNAINAIFFWQDDHCADAHWSEVRRLHFPREYNE